MKRRLKRFRKKFLRSNAITSLAVGVLVVNIWLVRKTTRWQYVGEEEVCRLINIKQPFLGCFWHGRLMMMPQAWLHMKLKNRPRFFMLNSAHFDGQLIGRVTRHFGIDQHVGSTRHKGLTAFRGLVRLLQQGHCVGMTPDGPRGPAFKASIGAATLAMVARVPIVPIAASTSYRRTMKTWDKFLWSLPFGRGVVVWGEPLWAKEGETAEDFRARAEIGFNKASALADTLTGHMTNA